MASKGKTVASPKQEPEAAARNAQAGARPAPTAPQPVAHSMQSQAKAGKLPAPQTTPIQGLQARSAATKLAPSASRGFAIRTKPKLGTGVPRCLVASHTVEKALLKGAAVSIPKRVHERFVAGLKTFLPIIAAQRARDVSEADTVTLVKDLFSDVFGFDKYAELTSEHAIRGTYCDLAIKLDNKLALLCEVKAIGVALEDKHVKQAVDYAANQGCEWVVLTNGVTWRLYVVSFGKPIDKKLVFELDITTVNLKDEQHLDRMFALTKEGFSKGAHVEMKDLNEATSRHLIGALLVENDSVLGMIRRELRRVVEANVAEETIRRVLLDEIIKRDVVDGPEWKEAAAKVNRKETRAMRTRKKDGDVEDSSSQQGHKVSSSDNATPQLPDEVS